MITTSEYHKLLAFISRVLSRSDYKAKSTIQAGDIANSIFLAHTKSTLKRLKTFVKTYINKERENEQKSRLSGKEMEHQDDLDAKRKSDKKASDLEHSKTPNKKSNTWEKEQRKTKTPWSKKRNLVQKRKKRQQKKDRDNLLPPKHT